ncbi:MAG: RdgB/HAM1 family non-canonical purine NTP pyrophosphatase [Caldisericaceae bacterium]
MFKILVATKNKGKSKEVKEILSDLPVSLIFLPESDTDEVVESGKTYAENALIKAKHFALKYKLPALADDSGLEIDALNGKPGIYSARFLGENSSFEEKINEILKLMKNSSQRSARFRSVSVLYLPKENKFFSAEGVVEGEILLKPQKKEGSGFGYDPIFKPDGFNESFSMLGEEIKNRISHRANALRQMKDIIQKELLGGKKMIEVKINGKRLPANKYVYEVFETVIMAIISTLKEIPEVETVEIKIVKEAPGKKD